MTIGLPQSWIDFFQQQDVDYDFKAEDEGTQLLSFRRMESVLLYRSGSDPDMGWTLYNVMHTADGTVSEEDGYVMGSDSYGRNAGVEGMGFAEPK